MVSIDITAVLFKGFDNAQFALKFLIFVALKILIFAGFENTFKQHTGTNIFRKFAKKKLHHKNYGCDDLSLQLNSSDVLLLVTGFNKLYNSQSLHAFR